MESTETDAGKDTAKDTGEEAADGAAQGGTGGSAGIPRQQSAGRTADDAGPSGTAGEGARR